MKYLLLSLLFASTAGAAVSTDSSKTGMQQITTTPVVCTSQLTATPADVDMVLEHAVCYRAGKYLYIDGHIGWVGAGTAGDLTITITGLTGTPVIDTAFLANAGGAGNNKNEARLGTALYFSSSAWFQYSVVYATTSTFEFAGGSAHLQGNTGASGASVKFSAKLPIVGW